VRGRGFSVRTVVAAVALGLVAFGAAIALATTTKSATTVIPENHNGEATAKCPKGTAVAQGGFSASVNQKTGTLVLGLERSSKRSWTASARALATKGHLTSTAYCAKPHKLSEETSSTPLPVNHDVTVKAHCPKGTNVRLGGFSMSGNIDEPFIEQLERTSARTLSVTVGALKFLTPKRAREAQAIAYCGKGSDLTAETDTVSLGNDTQNSAATATANCPAGKKLVMGGYRTSGFDGSGPYVRSFERGDGQSWSVTGFGFSESLKATAPTITAIAYCK
jgi:hypothetical protein